MNEMSGMKVQGKSVVAEQNSGIFMQNATLLKHTYTT